MGTRGYYVFKYKSKYYVFYNQYDSYPDGEHALGYRIVEELKHLTLEEMREYLKLFVEGYEKCDHIIDDYDEDDDDKDEDDKENSHKCIHKGEGSIHFDSLKSALKNPFNFDFKIEQSEPGNDIWIEYVYIVNLDQELIEMKHYSKKISFRLDKVPDNWCETFIKETHGESYYNSYIKSLDSKE